MLQHFIQSSGMKTSYYPKITFLPLSAAPLFGIVNTYKMLKIVKSKIRIYLIPKN